MIIIDGSLSRLITVPANPSWCPRFGSRPLRGQRMVEVLLVISEYRRGWEDALDVALQLKDWKKIKELEKTLRMEKITFLLDGPFLASRP